MSERFLAEVGSRIIGQRGGDTRKIAFAVGSFNEIPFPAESFDCAFLVAAIHHSLSPLKTLLDAKRVLKPGGALLMVELPASIVAVRKLRERAIRLSRTTGVTELSYTRGELDYMLRHAGFDHVSYYPVDSLTRGAVRKALRMSLRWAGLEDALRPPVYVIVARE